MTAPSVMYVKHPMCYACGVFAAVRRVAPHVREYRDVYAVTIWCTICQANSAYARSAA